jgi:hypothetical protein
MNLIIKTAIVQAMVIPSTPRTALSISKRLKIRKMIIFGRIHMEIEWVTILALLIMEKYTGMLFPWAEKVYIKSPVIIGRIIPDNIPAAILSYFSYLLI